MCVDVLQSPFLIPLKCFITKTDNSKVDLLAASHLQNLALFKISGNMKLKLVNSIDLLSLWRSDVLQQMEQCVSSFSFNDIRCVTKSDIMHCTAIQIFNWN